MPDWPAVIRHFEKVNGTETHDDHNRCHDQLLEQLRDSAHTTMVKSLWNALEDARQQPADIAIAES